MSPAKHSTRESCTCAACVACCERKPGWFKPGEAEKVAAFLKIPLDELFRDYLAVDWWVGGAEGDTFVLSPGIVSSPTGEEMPYVAHGRCVFLKRGRCSIHAVKPFECAGSWCGDGPVERSGSLHEQAAEAWHTPENQTQITALLGREPSAESGSIFDMFSFLGDA